MHKVFAARQTSLRRAAAVFFQNICPSYENIAKIKRCQPHQSPTVKPEVCDPNELQGINQMPQNVPENFALTFDAFVKLAFIDVKIKHVKHAQMREKKQKIKSCFHNLGLSKIQLAVAAPLW
jgi:hypothetical protein